MCTVTSNLHGKIYKYTHKYHNVWTPSFVFFSNEYRIKYMGKQACSKETFTHQVTHSFIAPIVYRNAVHCIQYHVALQIPVKGMIHQGARHDYKLHTLLVTKTVQKVRVVAGQW